MRLLDYVGTISFGLSGGAAAAAWPMDVIGVAMVGTITAVGGGTVQALSFSADDRSGRARPSILRWQPAPPSSAVGFYSRRSQSTKLTATTGAVD